MPATTKERIPGHLLVILCAGAITVWRRFVLRIVEEEQDAGSADSTQIQSTSSALGIEIEVEGFLGAANHGGTLPKPGDPIDDLSVLEGSDTVLPDLSGFENIRVTAPIEYSFEKGPATWSFSGKSGRLNQVPWPEAEAP